MNGNFTQVPNSLLECLYGSDLTSREIKVMLCIIRYTYGFHRDGAELSLSFISQATQINIPNMSRVIKQLIKKGLITRIPGSGAKPQLISIVKSTTSQTNNCQNDKAGITQIDNSGLAQIDNQEININKDINIDITNDDFSDDDPYSFFYADYGKF